jgi:hypothetical protein
MIETTKARAQRAANVKPHSTADDRRRKPAALVANRGRGHISLLTPLVAAPEIK